MNIEPVLILNPEIMQPGLRLFKNSIAPVTPDMFGKLDASEKANIRALITGRGAILGVAEVERELPNLSVAGILGASLRKYDPEILLDRNVSIFNTAEVYASAVAEYCLMAAIMGRRRAGISHNIIKKGGWGIELQTTRSQLLSKIHRKAHKFFRSATITKPNPFKAQGGENEFGGCDVGLIGYGQITDKFIQLLKPFNCNLMIASNHLSDNQAKALGAKSVATEEALRCDIVSIHKGLSDQSRHFLGKREMALIPAGSTLINTSRAGLIDPEALLQRLRKNDIFACIDVFENEPLERNSPLRSLPNVFLTSHVSGSTSETYYKSTLAILEKVSTFLNTNGRAPDPLSRDRINNMT